MKRDTTKLRIELEQAARWVAGAGFDGCHATARLLDDAAQEILRLQALVESVPELADAAEVDHE